MTKEREIQGTLFELGEALPRRREKRDTVAPEALKTEPTTEMLFDVLLRKQAEYEALFADKDTEVFRPFVSTRRASTVFQKT